MTFPLFANPHHRNDYDKLQEKLWRAKVWLRIRRKQKPIPMGIPSFLRGGNEI